MYPALAHTSDAHKLFTSCVQESGLHASPSTKPAQNGNTLEPSDVNVTGLPVVTSSPVAGIFSLYTVGLHTALIYDDKRLKIGLLSTYNES